MAKVPRVLVLNGPNLNLLGTREPEVYGAVTLGEIERLCRKRGGELGLSLAWRQSNSEGQLVDWIQEAREAQDGLILNAGAYTHTSIAILDALKAVALPTIEVHLSNIHQRESFRSHSYVSLAAFGVIAGFGKEGYLMALWAMARHFAAAEEAR